jgi:signal transduction histidine kinase
MTIRVRLTLAYGAALIVTLLLIGAGVWWVFGGALRAALDQALLERAIGVLATVENDPRAGLQEVDQPGEVDVDHVRLGQALANLLNNAILHGPADARVTISGRIVPDRGHGASTLEFAVADAGPGIPEAVRETLFLPFQRGPEAIPTAHGLGLAIADASVKAHGGRLTLDPNPGGGTLARIRIPLADRSGAGP